MSHGSDDARHAPANRSYGILGSKPRLRFTLFAAAAVLTWLCLEAWLSLIYPEYPIGSYTRTTTWFGFALGWFFATVAFLIAFIVIRTKPSKYLFAYIAFGSLTLLATFAFSNAVDDQVARLTIRSKMAAIIGPLGLIAVAFAFASYASAPVIENLRLHLPEKRVILAFILPIAAWLVIGLVWPFTPFNPVVHPNAPDYVADIHSALGGSFSATLLYLAILVPIAEEIMFRGLITPLLCKATNLYIATFLSAAVFALFHIDPNYFSFNQVIYIFCLGILLAITMFKTRSIWPGIALHALNNAWVSLNSIDF